ncbi:MAG TPA: hypothetical protein GX695_05465 [Acholeplasmataceae bacterium]|nr:hypothetical protein [Acholeplasmataceae bacterium]
MPINLHFFRNNELEKLDYSKVFEFFDNYPAFTIFYGEDDVQIICSDDDFKFTYRYLVTKKSRVKDIYKLDPTYSNVNFMLELPVMIPNFLAKEILNITLKICKTFNLAIYHDSFKDVKDFNSVDVLMLFEKMRNQYINEFGLTGKIKYPTQKLSEICKYQRSIDSLKEMYHNQIDVLPITPIQDKKTNEFGISVIFHIGHPTIFPPNLDFVYIHDELNNIFLVKRVDFYSIIGKYLIEIDSVLPDMYILKKKQAKSSRKIINKLRKEAIEDNNFTNIRICDLIDDI